MRRYLKGEDSDYITIINSKIYGNPGDNLGSKIRKRGRRNSGFNHSGADVIRIRFNPLFFYNAGSE